MFAVITIAMGLVLIPVIAMPGLAPVSPVVAVAVAIAVAVISAIVPVVIPIALVALCVCVVAVSAITPVLLFGEGAARKSNHQGCRC